MKLILCVICLFPTGDVGFWIKPLVRKICAPLLIQKGMTETEVEEILQEKARYTLMLGAFGSRQVYYEKSDILVFYSFRDGLVDGTSRNKCP